MEQKTAVLMQADAIASLVYRLCSIPSFERKKDTVVEQKLIPETQKFGNVNIPFGTENWYGQYYQRILSFCFRYPISEQVLTSSLVLILRFCKRFPLTLTNPQDTLFNVFVGSVFAASLEVNRIEFDDPFWDLLTEYQPHIRMKLGHSFLGLENLISTTEVEQMVLKRTQIHHEYNCMLQWFKNSLELGEFDSRFITNDCVSFLYGVLISISYHLCYPITDQKRYKIYPHQQIHSENRLSGIFHCCSIFFGLMNSLLHHMDPPLQVLICTVILMGKYRTIKSNHGGNGRIKANILYQTFVGALIHAFKINGIVMPITHWSKSTGFTAQDLNFIEAEFSSGLQGYVFDSDTIPSFQNLLKQFFDFYTAIYEESLMRPETQVLLQKSCMDYTARFVREVNRQVFAVIYTIPSCFRRTNIEVKDRIEQKRPALDNRKIILHFWSVSSATARNAFQELVDYCTADASVTIIAIQTDAKEDKDKLRQVYTSHSIPDNLICLDHLYHFQDLYVQAQMGPFSFCIIIFQKKVLYIGPSSGSPFFDALPEFGKLFPCTQKNWTSPCLNESLDITTLFTPQTMYHSRSKSFDPTGLHDIIVIRYWASTCDMSLKTWPLFVQDVDQNHGFMSFFSVQMLPQNHQTDYEQNEQLLQEMDLSNVVSIVDHDHKFKNLLFDCEFFFIPALIIIQKGKIVHVGCDKKEKCTFGHKIHCNC